MDTERSTAEITAHTSKCFVKPLIYLGWNTLQTKICMVNYLLFFPKLNPEGLKWLDTVYYKLYSV